MKFLIALTLALAGVAAQADTTVQRFAAPTGVAPSVPVGASRCTANGYNPDGSIFGACTSRKSTACSGRGCQPTTYTSFYNSLWDAAGVGISATLCKTVRHHAPQVDTTTYAPGFGPGDCTPLVVGGTSVVAVNGVPYYLIAVSPDGLTELVFSQQSYLVTF